MWASGIGMNWVRTASVGLLSRMGCLKLTLVAALAICGSAAASPVLEFDLPQMAVARTCEAGQATKVPAGMKVVEVPLDFSLRLLSGSESELKHVTIEIRSPERQLSVVGYTPQTTLLSESSDGVIQVEEHRGAGQINIEYGMPVAKIQASSTNGGESKIVERRVAPKLLAIASGTVDRSHGVFFTLYPSKQDSLQKTRQFVCRFAVPLGFRADYVQVTCTAIGQHRGNEIVAGQARFTVGVYLDDDIEARHAVERLAERQQTVAALMARSSDSPVERHWWTSMQTSMRFVSNKRSSRPANAAADEVTQAALALETAQRAVRQLNGF